MTIAVDWDVKNQKVKLHRWTGWTSEVDVVLALEKNYVSVDPDQLASDEIPVTDIMVTMVISWYNLFTLCLVSIICPLNKASKMKLLKEAETFIAQLSVLLAGAILLPV